jgi:pyruvate/2-oxoglutarate dehydrogenase complex dihydrolipoamide acyltransferase (E2) component
VDSPFHAPERSWRTATLIATAIAGVELILLLAAGFLLLGKSLLPHVEAAAEREASTPAKAHRAPARAPAPAAKPEPAVAKLTREKTFVLVLNGNGQTGAAASAAQLVAARGYKVQDVGDAPRRNYARSVVVYRPGFRGEAKRFARDLSVPVVTADGMKKGQFRGAQLALVVGAH